LASSEVISSPAIGSGIVVFKSLDNRITALDAVTGLKLWVVQRPASGLILRVRPQLVINEDFIYVPSNSGRLLSLSLQNGFLNWEAIVSEPKGSTDLERVVDISGTPVIYEDDLCVIAFQGKISCINLSSGQSKWSKDFSSVVGPDVDNFFVFAIDESDKFFAFLRDNGNILWNNSDFINRNLSSPLSFGRTVVVGDDLGYMHFLSREKGEVIGRINIGSGIVSKPLINDSNLIIQTNDGKIMAISVD